MFVIIITFEIRFWKANVIKVFVSIILINKSIQFNYLKYLHEYIIGIIGIIS